MNRPARIGPGSSPLALQDAKARFSEVVEAAMRGRVQQVTRRGRPAVVIVSVSEYETLLRRGRADAGGFVEHLLAQPRAEGKTTTRSAARGQRGDVLRPRDIDFSD